MKKIKLTQGKYALVDDDQFLKLSKYKWGFQIVYKGITKIGYVYTSTYNKGKKSRIYMHRMIMNAPKNRLVDHINHNTLDNRLSNLRLCTNAQNQFNEKIKTINKTSKYKGVHLHKKTNSWYSNIVYMGKDYFLGSFVSEREAAKAYDKKAKELYREFAHPNFI